MNVVFLTTDDPLYLPAFFEHVLAARPDTAAVLVVPPLYRNQTALAAARRYLRTFGPRALHGLAVRTLAAKLRRRSIASTCRAHGVRCVAVKDVNDDEVRVLLERAAPDVLVSVSCPQILGRPLVELPPMGCLNVHGAILPHYRGVLPSFWMLANGEDRAGVSIFFVNETIDGGDLCGQRSFEIGSTDTLDDLLRRSKAVAADLLVDVLERVEHGTVSRQELDVDAGSYYSWPDREAVRRFRAAGRKLW